MRLFSLYSVPRYLWGSAETEDVISFNAAISACEKCGQWQEGPRGILDMPRMGR